MRWNKKAKLTATTTTALLFTLLLSACGSNNTNVNTPVISQDVEQDQTTEFPSQGAPDESGLIDPQPLEGNEETDTSSSTTNNQAGTKDDTTGSSSEVQAGETVLSAKGIYTGAIDNHSIEIEVNGEYLVLQIDSNFEYLINDFNSDQAVQFKYVERSTEDGAYTQLWLTSIEVIS